MTPLDSRAWRNDPENCLQHTGSVLVLRINARTTTRGCRIGDACGCHPRIHSEIPVFLEDLRARRPIQRCRLQRPDTCPGRSRDPCAAARGHRASWRCRAERDRPDSDCLSNTLVSINFLSVLVWLGITEMKISNRTSRPTAPKRITAPASRRASVRQEKWRDRGRAVVVRLSVRPRDDGNGGGDEDDLCWRSRACRVCC